MNATFKQIEFILYVADQNISKEFYKNLFQSDPVLDVPGMTEFQLADNCKLGLMPNAGIAKIITPALPHPDKANGIPRCELYLYVDKIDELWNTINASSTKVVDPLAARDWGDKVFYIADPDAHVIAFAERL